MANAMWGCLYSLINLRQFYPSSGCRAFFLVSDTNEDTEMVQQEVNP